MSARDFVGYLRSERTYKLPRKDLDQLRLRKLRNALAYAYQENSVWKETFRQAGFSPEDVNDLQSIRKMPLVSKADMMKVQDAARAAGRLEGTKVVMSSGTTGTPSGFARGRGRSSINGTISVRTKMLIGLRPWSRVATLWAPQRFWKNQIQDDGSSRPYTGLYRNPMWRYRRILRNILTLWVDPMDPVRDGKALADFHPEFIYGRPSHLRRIARACGKDLGVRPKVIAAGGEIITKTGFKELRDAYGAKVVREYGSSDVGKLGVDCLFERGLHVWEDFRIYEVLKDGEPVSPGEVGELVVTNLERDSIPYIRFRTGDYVRLGDDDLCGCGSHMRRLSSIEGRANDWVIGANGEKFLATEVADRLEYEFNIRDFQLVQTGQFAFTLLLRSDDLERQVEIAGVKKYLGELAGAAVQMDVRQRSDDDYWLKTRPVVYKAA